MDFKDPIYGTFEEPYTIFVAPGIFVTVIFFLSTMVTSTIIISDRLDGVWDRTLVAGVSTSEVLLTHMFVQTVVMFIQVLEILLLGAYVFNMTSKGYVSLIVCILMLQGLAGMCFGLFISVICSSHSMANYMATGSFYPMLLLCGILWPIEGMPIGLRWIALSLPFTIPTMSLRNIISKGWDASDPQVYNGFVVVSIWIVVLTLLCFVGMKSHK